MLTENTEQRKSRPQSRGKKIFRLCFRCCRIFILLVLLVVVTSLFFLNKVGLPEFVKRKVLAQLQAKGWEGGFSRLRLRFYRGVVAENLFLERANKEPGPHVFVDEAVCHFDYRALIHRAIVVDAVRLRGGKLIWPMAHTNQPLPAAQISDVQGVLKFNPDDQWELSNLSGQIVGLHVRITGTLTNASFVRDWKLQRRPGDKRLSEESLRRLMQTWQQIKFARPPQIDIKFGANAANVKESSAELDCRGSGVASPWLTGTNFLLVARLMPSPLSNEWFQATVELKAERAHLPKIGADTRLLQLSASLQPPFTNLFPANANLVFALEEPRSSWGTASHLDLSTHITPDPSNPGTLKSDLSLAAFDVKTKWLRSTNIQLALAASHSTTNWNPAAVSGRVQVRHPDSNQGRADLATIDFQGSIPPTNQWRLTQTNLDWPSRVANFPLRGTIQVSNVHSTKLELTTLAMTADWKAPVLAIKTDARLYDGTLSAEARLETITRDLAFKALSHFDPHKAERLLTTNSQRWLASYAWKDAPHLRAEGRVRLPDWMDREVDWKKEVMPAFAVSGDFEVGQGSYRGIPFSSARSPFIFTNMIWHIPSLKVTRPEGTLEADYYSDQRTRDFHWELRSGIDPKIIRPLFTSPQSQRIFDLLEFGSPPQIEAELWGRWYDTQRLGAAGKVTLTNCAFRGEKVDYASSWIRYTNELISLFEPKVRAGGREGNAVGIAIDLVTQKLYFTNAVGDLDPYSVGRAISKRTGEILEPYHFDVPPVVKVSGSVDLKKGRHEDDMHFDLAGHRFRWQTYLLQQITGNIDWTGRHLSLTNVHGTFRTGQIAGNADFYFQPDNGSFFSFNITGADVDLHTFVEQTGLKTNKLEGSLTGELHVTRGVTEDWRNVDGNGRFQLKDGLLWDIPLFGVFSPVLNAIIPGLGNSRAKEGTASFVMTNGTLFTKDLEIRASAMRMNYQGTVDLRERVDGRMEAELLRDLPAIGFIISKVLWPVTKLFEYRITGTLGDPKTQPLYVLPKILLMPFHPIKTIKDLIPEDTRPAPEPPPPTPSAPKPS